MIHLRPLERKGMVDLWADTRINAGAEVSESAIFSAIVEERSVPDINHPPLSPFNDIRYSFSVMLNFSIFVLLTGIFYGFTPTWGIAGEEPQIPAGASWGMTLKQIQQLPELERDAGENLQKSYIIRGTSKDEFVALWKDRPISFLVSKDLGLYAINVEMTPRAIQHTQNAADQELLDLEQLAPIRFAIMQKYGPPLGLAITWETSEISPLPQMGGSAAVDVEDTAIQWPYARSWLVWEGAETRLALGEQSVWYASRVGLATQRRAKKDLEKEGDRSLDRELARRAQRQQQIEDARETVASRASAVEPFF
jgi:hypothetical protein